MFFKSIKLNCKVLLIELKNIYNKISLTKLATFGINDGSKY